MGKPMNEKGIIIIEIERKLIKTQTHYQENVQNEHFYRNMHSISRCLSKGGQSF